jgi:hypothetical protein
MMVLNAHARTLNASISDVGAWIDSLASREDKIWPCDRWVPMTFDKPLEVGASGGHGPIGYDVETYDPGRSVSFRFTRPAGFVGRHRFETAALASGQVALRHVIEMRTTGISQIMWPLVIRPLHNALIEDAFDRAESNTGGSPPQRSWSIWVRLLRYMMSKGRIVRKRPT